MHRVPDVRGAIAEETDYADAPTFSKAFKRRNGVSPAEWRQNAKGVAH